MTPRLVTQPGPLPPIGLRQTANELDVYLGGLWTYIITLILSTLCLGIFSVLAFLSTIVLVQKGLRRRATVILLTVIFIMYVSTAATWSTHLLNAVGYHTVVQAYSAQMRCQCQLASRWDVSSVNSWPEMCPSFGYGLPGPIHALTLCAPTIILSVNVLLGDAIVWWRVWTIWPDSLVVHMTCIVLLAATMEMSIMDANNSCPPEAFMPLMPGNLSEVPSGALFQKNLFGLTASVLSLATNFVATALIWIKAWEHRISVERFSKLRRSSRIERVLVLLVESGFVYCLLWTVVVAYQMLWQLKGLDATEQQVSAFDYFIRACLIPLVGMYPTVIILLVALDKSHFSTASVSLTGEGSSISSIRFRYTGGSKAKESVCLDRGYGKADSALLSSMVG